MPTEKTITKAIIAYLKSLGCWYVKVPGSHKGRGGIPDILICHRGLFYAIEVKKQYSYPTRLQERELAAIIQAGGLAFVARSVDDVRRVLEAERRLLNVIERSAEVNPTRVTVSAYLPPEED